jgi:competence protein ComGC
MMLANEEAKMRRTSRRSCRYGQWTLIGLLVTITIIIILAAVYIPRIAARHSAPGEARTPTERAYGAACSIYEGQINQAVMMYKQDNDNQAPQSLDDLKKYGVTDDIVHADGCYFVMNPHSGYVQDVGGGTYVAKKPKVRRHRYMGAAGFHPDSRQASLPPPVYVAPETNYGSYSTPPPVGAHTYTPAPVESPGDDTSSTAPASPPPSNSGGSFYMPSGVKIRMPGSSSPSSTDTGE